MRILKNILKNTLSKIIFFALNKRKITNILINQLLVTDVGEKNLIEREKWIEKVLSDIPAGKTILDAGAGELRYKKFCFHLKYTSQDFGQYNGKNSDEGLQIGKWDNSQLDIVSDIVNIPVPNESYDAIMCIEVLEHIPAPIKAIKEFNRILKKNGQLIITAPFCSLTHFAPYYFANGYSKYWYEQILKENGFEIESIDFNGNYFEYLAQEIKRLPNMEEKYLSSKLMSEPINQLASKIFLGNLAKFSKEDKSSHELLCFGLQILAKKI